MPYPTYKFVRNGASSVDYLEATELVDLYASLHHMMSGSDFDLESRQQDFDRIYWQGTGATLVHPRALVASSALLHSSREQVLGDLDKLIQRARSISRSTRATPESGGGYIGRSRSDVNALFVDERGLVVSSAFQLYALGASTLDRMLGVHLLPTHYADPHLKEAHEGLLFSSGGNYTTLEHHWDMAYGYYSVWRPWAESDGISELKDAERRISYAFAQGRLDLTELRYPMATAHLASVYQELSRVLAIRTIHLFVGKLTLLNLEEGNLYALRFVSEGIGMLYALQFTRRTDGSLYLDRAEVERLVSSLLEGEGLWDRERLLSPASVSGSLRSVATRVAELYGLDVASIVR